MSRRYLESRRRLQLFIITTVLFLAGILIIYGQRTGKLTIFGDVATLPGLVTVSDEIDLAKGVSVGDGNATIISDEAGTWLTLATGTTTGTAQYDIGNPEIAVLQRFKPLPTPPQPAGTAIQVQFAGSLDGVAYSRHSEPVTIQTGTDLPDAIDLVQLLPQNSHFVRVRITLTSPDQTVQPRFAGFSINYDVTTGGQIGGSGTVGADPITATQVTVNSTVAGSTAAPATPSTPSNLASTGVGDWVIFLMFVFAIGGALFYMKNNRGYGGRR